MRAHEFSILLAVCGTLIASGCSKTTRNQRGDGGGEGGESGEGGTRSITSSAASSGGSGASANVSSGGSDGSGGTATGGEAGDGGTGNASNTGGTGGVGGTSGTGGATASGGTSGTGDSTGTGGASPTGSGGTNGMPTWCDEQTPPSGVSASDFACADFDSGFPEGWTVSDADGRLSLTEAVAKSAPTSLNLLAPALVDASNVSTLSWTSVGAAPVTLASISVSVNPMAQGGAIMAYDTFIEIVCLDGGDGRACVNYTEGATVDFAPYTGFFLKWTVASGAPVLAEFPIGQATNNLWTDISLSMQPDGEIVASVGSESVTVPNQGVPPTTSITAVVGGDSRYGDSGPYNLRMDDVLVIVTR